MCRINRELASIDPMREWVNRFAGCGTDDEGKPRFTVVDVASLLQNSAEAYRQNSVFPAIKTG
jgi:hypothetical protein